MEKIHYLEKELKEVLKKESSIFDFLQENFLDGIWYWDLENPQHEWMSDKLWHILGFDPNEKEHSPNEWQDLIFKEDLELAINNLEKHLENPEHKYAQLVRYKHKNGSTVWIHCIGIALRDDNNKAIRMLGAHNDVTELMNLKEEHKNKERLLLAQSKTAAIGEMIGNIAHQWRQPLNLITTQTTSLKFSLEIGHEASKEALVKTMDNITHQAQYLSKTIDDFRDFFRGSTSDIAYFNLKNAFDKIYSLTKDSLKNNYITYVCDILDCDIKGNENLFVQVLINIFNNAKDVMKEIKEDKYLFISTKIEKGFLYIDIKDSGGGIKLDILDRIFDPYFTTKGKVLGTGIGLYMSNEIVTKQFNGDIKASNSSYEYEQKALDGAVFTIKIPFI